jgi:hypothetical protein
VNHKETLHYVQGVLRFHPDENRDPVWNGMKKGISVNQSTFSYQCNYGSPCLLSSDGDSSGTAVTSE